MPRSTNIHAVPRESEKRRRRKENQETKNARRNPSSVLPAWVCQPCRRRYGTVLYDAIRADLDSLARKDNGPVDEEGPDATAHRHHLARSPMGPR